MEWVVDRLNVSMDLLARACKENREMIWDTVECETPLKHHEEVPCCYAPAAMKEKK